jgi:hypothetical protein
VIDRINQLNLLTVEVRAGRAVTFETRQNGSRHKLIAQAVYREKV